MKTTESVSGAQHMLRFWVPVKFWDDHSDRAPSDDGEAGMMVEERRGGSRVLVRGNAQQIECLRSDAAFYAEGNVDDSPGLVASAKRTIAALEVPQ